MTVVVCDVLLFMSFVCVLLHGMLMYKIMKEARINGTTKTLTQSTSGLFHLLIAFTLLGIITI
jgi:hypothetical protein